LAASEQAYPAVMTALPRTRIPASAQKAAAIREAVRRADFPATGHRRLAGEGDASGFLRLIADPSIGERIYTLPRPATLATVRDFIARHVEERIRGEGLLICEFDEEGDVEAYNDFRFWPEWAACELGGAIRPDRQGAGRGGAGAAAAFQWLFEKIGVELICETAALDNIRTRKLLERLGFDLIGEIDIELPDGSVRPSLYFELSLDGWRLRRAAPCA
jgi:RimJ/RimL family protein N-acetyltransferase